MNPLITKWALIFSFLGLNANRLSFDTILFLLVLKGFDILIIINTDLNRSPTLSLSHLISSHYLLGVLTGRVTRFSKATDKTNEDLSYISINGLY